MHCSRVVYQVRADSWARVLYTEFDWRIGILAGRPLYACQYFMSKRNWKIVEHQADGGVRHGRWKTYPVEQVPADIVATALRATSLIGDGLYGVDLKQTAKGPVVIEVNDNPSIDSGMISIVFFFSSTLIEISSSLLLRS